MSIATILPPASKPVSDHTTVVCMESVFQSAATCSVRSHCPLSLGAGGSVEPGTELGPRSTPWW